MAHFEDSWMVRLQDSIAAAAVFRRLGALCAPAAAEPLPPAMAALVARLAAAAPMNGKQPQPPADTP